jgi:hypothetical protein
MVPYKEYVSVVDPRYTKDTRGPKVSKKVILFLYAEHVFFYLY